MKQGILRLVAGGIALLGGLAGLFNPATAQVASTTIAGWALLIVGVLQARSAMQSETVKEKAGASLFAAAGCFLGLSLVFGPFGDGSLLTLILGGLLIVSGAAKLWIARGMTRDAFFVGLAATGGVSLVLGVLVLAGVAMPLGVIVSIELLVDGVALIILALRPGKPPTKA